jgi:hypothetical protein
MTKPFHDINSDEELDESKTSMIQMIDFVDVDILYSGRGNKKDIHWSDDHNNIIIYNSWKSFYFFRCSIQIVPGWEVEKRWNCSVRHGLPQFAKEAFCTVQCEAQWLLQCEMVPAGGSLCQNHLKNEGFCLPRSYRGILDEARMRKHTQISIQYQIWNSS